MVFCRILVPLLCASIGLVFSSCKGDADKSRASNLIPEEEFIELLVDFSLSESASSINVKQAPNRHFDSVYSFNPLIERNIRKSQYDSTLAYYSLHITEYKAVYDAVLQKIGSLQAQNSGKIQSKAQE